MQSNPGDDNGNDDNTSSHSEIQMQKENLLQYAVCSCHPGLGYDDIDSTGFRNVEIEGKHVLLEKYELCFVYKVNIHHETNNQLSVKDC